MLIYVLTVRLRRNVPQFINGVFLYTVICHTLHSSCFAMLRRPNFLGKSERTREFVLDGLNAIQKAFIDHNLIANIRLETYEGDRYFHVPPPTM
jgi:hypothetical protein